jgi:hypothetical protein
MWRGCGLLVSRVRFTNLDRQIIVIRREFGRRDRGHPIGQNAARQVPGETSGWWWRDGWRRRRAAKKEGGAGPKVAVSSIGDPAVIGHVHRDSGKEVQSALTSEDSAATPSVKRRSNHPGGSGRSDAGDCLLQAGTDGGRRRPPGHQSTMEGMVGAATDGIRSLRSSPSTVTVGEGGSLSHAARIHSLAGSVRRSPVPNP